MTAHLERGAFTISIDVERLWGVWDKVSARDEAQCRAHEDAILAALLRLFREYDIPATWALVGRLLDDEDGYQGLRGPPSGWYAPEILEQIVAEPQAHEIGSHSYAHVYYGHISAEAAAQDLARASAVHRKRGTSFRSFVFPRNDIGHLGELAKAGLRVFRGVDAGLLAWADRHAPRLRPAVNVLEKAVPLAPPIVFPVLHKGHEGSLVELPTSILLLARRGLRRVIRPGLFAYKLERGLEAAVEQAGVFHLWFHPSNFYRDADTQVRILDETLEHAARLRDAGRLDVRTMDSFAA